MTRTLILAALGGALCSSLRAASGFVLPFPFATFTVNVLGSVAIGLQAVPLLRAESGPHPLAPPLIVGVLGGFTTFSAFSLDTLRLVEGGREVAALLYMGGSVALSLGTGAAGLALARRLA